MASASCRWSLTSHGSGAIRIFHDSEAAPVRPRLNRSRKMHASHRVPLHSSRASSWILCSRSVAQPWSAAMQTESWRPIARKPRRRRYQDTLSYPAYAGLVCGRISVASDYVAPSELRSLRWSGSPGRCPGLPYPALSGLLPKRVSPEGAP